MANKITLMIRLICIGKNGQGVSDASTASAAFLQYAPTVWGEHGSDSLVTTSDNVDATEFIVLQVDALRGDFTPPVNETFAPDGYVAIGKCVHLVKFVYTGSQSSNERQYLNLLRRIMDYGSVRADRTGTGTLSTFGELLHFDISNGVPLMTTKFVSWRTVILELLWFLRGDTDVKKLQDVGVHIWDANSTREFLDNRGLHHLREHDAGAIYGHSIRHFGALYRGCDVDYSGEGVDQIKYVIDEISREPTSRRIFMSNWNPSALRDQALPPCHTHCQWYVRDGGVIDCMFYMRSNDTGAGACYNIFSYTVLTYIIAKKTGLRPGALKMVIGDAHIYKNHVDQLKLQLTRAPLAPPLLVLSDDVAVKDFNDLTIDDFNVVGYLSHPPIKVPMNA